MRLKLPVFAVLMLVATYGWAGQPWFGSPEGIFYRWSGGTINWIYDPGDLASGYTNADAVKIVQEAFDKWAKAGLQTTASGGFVTTVTLQPVMQGKLPSDVTTENYMSIITNADYYPTIIFDTDGSILTDLCKTQGCEASFIMAYTIIIDQQDLDPKSHGIIHGVTILNGSMINKPDIDIDRFKASVIHEIGHLLGLDHTGLNDEFATTKDSQYNPALKTSMDQAIPTMYPVNLTKEQGSLHMDDVVAISTLYPSSGMNGQFCTVTGKITDTNGVGIQGIEVVARTTTSADFATNAVSTMTGVEFPIPTKDGHYYIRGIVPAKTYTVGFAPLPKFATNGSGIGRFGLETGVLPPGITAPAIKDAPNDLCDPDFPSCDITAAGGSVKEVTCDKGGQLIVMDPVALSTVTVDPKYATAPTPAVNEPQPAAPAGKSGGCSLVK